VLLPLENINGSIKLPIPAHPTSSSGYIRPVNPVWCDHFVKWF